MSSGLQTQQATLARHENMLYAIYTSVTLRDAAREQREGRSMRFDEICAARARPSPIAFPPLNTHTGPPVTNPGPQLPPGSSLANPMENDGENDGGLHGFPVRAHAWPRPIY